MKMVGIVVLVAFFGVIMKLLATYNRLNGSVACYRWTAVAERDADKCRWLSSEVVSSLDEADAWFEEQREFAELVEMERSCGA